jgi:catechol 2,3-dioxygenase-like lactoylglutathione lyase family enzyme
MKQLIFFALLNLSSIYYSQSQNQQAMKLNAGIITDKIQETKEFYTQNLGFGISFENEFYLLLHTPNQSAQLSFLLPNHPTQQPLFQPSFQGRGMYLTIEVDDVDAVYAELKSKQIPIEIDIRDEPWGDRHFAIQDPNGIGIDIVTYSAPE